MKLILIPVFIVCVHTAFAQDQPHKPVKPNKAISPAPKLFKVPYGNTLIDRSTLVKVLEDGNKIYALPLDGMPCLVPAQTNANMPTLQPRLSPNSIPNPASPSVRNTMDMSAQQLKQLLDLQQSKKHDKQ